MTFSRESYFLTLFPIRGIVFGWLDLLLALLDGGRHPGSSLPHFEQETINFQLIGGQFQAGEKVNGSTFTAADGMDSPFESG